ncbi:hypothetical protein IHE55_28025 [Streptomyces pactum]|uniref:Uncharacterized protein n=1 Tax=Streptomyces pactum TaxID=68249 RepID=A0ABS0NT88_9ACTN|nr:hypothetical protein [Streptomyces pactum]MBH5338428.1 hypothetical protein [Streptomyces pactum]
MIRWEAERQRWDRAAELDHLRRRARSLERKLLIAAVVLAVLAAVTLGSRYLSGYH